MYITIKLVSVLIYITLLCYFSIYIFDKINKVKQRLSTDYLFSQIFGDFFKISDEQYCLQFCKISPNYAAYTIIFMYTLLLKEIHVPWLKFILNWKMWPVKRELERERIIGHMQRWGRYSWVAFNEKQINPSEHKQSKFKLI